MLLLAGLFVLIYLMVFAGALMAEAWSSPGYPVQVYLAAAGRDLWKALPYATIGAILWILIAYFFHQKMIDAVTGTEAVTRQEQPRLYNLLENLCISRGIAMPRLKIMPDEALNAFATGMNPRQYSITVTTGLMAALDDDEMEAVLGHELTHIRNGDVQMMVIAMIIAGVVGFVAELVVRGFFNSGIRYSNRTSSSDNNKSSGGGAVFAIIIAVALIAAAWALSLVVRMALSRSREFLADAGAVELTKNPDAMISALRKIENRGELPGATSAVMEMCIDNPREGFADLFATHPSVDKRVAALVQFAGGRDPGPIEPGPIEPGPLALPDDASNEGETQENIPESSALPPPRRGPFGRLHGPWG